MKGLVLNLLLISVILFLPSIAIAQPRRLQQALIRNKIKEIRQEMKQEKKTLLEEFKAKIKSIRQSVAKIIGAEVTEKSGASLNVLKDNKVYTINTDSRTQIRRHYWGKSSFDEISVGNKVNIHGIFTDDSKTTILASLIRDLSIMKRHGVFLGDVTVKNSDNFVINSKQRGDQTVYFTGSTKFVKRNEEAMIYADLQLSHRVRIKGIWDKTLNQITETVQVKDFTLPPKPTKAAGPTTTVTPTLTSTPTP